MNKKQIILLSIIFVALVLGLALKFFIEQRDARVTHEVYSSLSLAVDPVKVERVLIARGLSEPIELAKKNDHWIVQDLWDAKADTQKIKELFDAVRDLKGELRGTDSALFKDFGIGDPDAISLKLTGANNAPMLDLKIGTQKPGHDGFFVRKTGSSEVYFVETPFDRLFGIFMPIEEAKLAADFWADLTLFDLVPEKVRKITVSHLNGDTVASVAGVERLAQKDAPPEGGWKLVGPQQAMPVDPEKILRFITVMNNMKAKSVVDSGEKGEQPVWRLVVTDTDGKETVLEAGPKDEKENVYFVKVRDIPQAFYLGADFFEDLDIKNEQFLKEAPKTEPVGKNS